jgi:uncharacterized membrane protein YeaQ/YmgE (transglycosylase-associated protein family)
MITALIAWTIFGLIAGGIARFLVPGHQPMGCFGTILLGIVGSLAGGFLSWLIWGGEPLQTSGWIMSILGAVLVLAISIRMSRPR